LRGSGARSDRLARESHRHIVRMRFTV
jgi:hypothetical protein